VKLPDARHLRVIQMEILPQPVEIVRRILHPHHADLPGQVKRSGEDHRAGGQNSKQDQ
jgi:hypothetical protein